MVRSFPSSLNLERSSSSRTELRVMWNSLVFLSSVFAIIAAAAAPSGS